MSAAPSEIVVNPENQWRLRTPGAEGWARSAHPNAADKYFMVSVDSHLGPPPTLFRDRIDKQYVDQLARIEIRDGKKYFVVAGRRPRPLVDDTTTGEDLARSRAGSGIAAMSLGGGSTVPERIAHQRMDGFDAEIIFPNGPAMMMFGSDDPQFVLAQCRIYNDWAWEACEPYKETCLAAAAIPTADVELAVAEVERTAKMGYRVLTLPVKPVFGSRGDARIGYNQKVFDPLWAAVQDAGLPVTFHVSTGSDPRVARGEGGAVMNYIVGGLVPTIEPVVALCASGVLERFTGLRFATIEANAGWLPWVLDTMDEGYRKHHMWATPRLKMLPSEYFLRQGAASVCDDRSAMLLVEKYALEDSLMFANDYPHHEGSWPHSAQAAERTMGALGEGTRRKILGLNAARFFGIEVPAAYRD